MRIKAIIMTIMLLLLVGLFAGLINGTSVLAQMPPMSYKYLHGEQVSLLDLFDPVSTQWHELYPEYCNHYEITEWWDQGDLMICLCDLIELENKDTGIREWYHVEMTTFTFYLKEEDTENYMYIEFPSLFAMAEFAVNHPEGSEWLEVWPHFGTNYVISVWDDNGDGILSPCDQIQLDSTWYHVEDVAFDIVISSLCGNETLDPGEVCDPPALNSPQCPQENQCEGLKWCEYPDDYGDCTDQCQCVYDTPTCSCVIDLCGAECAPEAENSEQCENPTCVGPILLEYSDDYGDCIECICVPDIPYRTLGCAFECGAECESNADCGAGELCIGCFCVQPCVAQPILTYGDGTPMVKELDTLRDFRDEYLLTNPVGQAFVSVYYKVSPPMAEFIIEHPALKPVLRAGLVPMVAIANVATNIDLPQKMAIGSLLVLVPLLLVGSIAKNGGSPGRRKR